MLGSPCSPCCSGLCSASRTKATITFSGLPAVCGSSVYDNRTLADDNCSYPLFRVHNHTDPEVCKYATVWHSKQNKWNSAVPFDGTRVILDLNTDRLRLIDETLTVEFAPPSGQSFRTFPFSSVVVPLSVVGNMTGACTAESFASVVVTIDDSAPAYTPFKCPGAPWVNATTEYCDCEAGVDTVPQVSVTVTNGSVSTRTYKQPLYHCSPCDTNPYSVQTESWDFNTGPLGYSSSMPELTLQVSFQPSSEASYLSQLSGAYALKWTPPGAFIGNGPYLGLYGSGNNTLWSNLENTVAEQGWYIDYRIPAQAPFAAFLGLTLVVVPVKALIAINRETGVATALPCGADQIAYEVKAAVFRGSASAGIGSSYQYWTWDMSSHAMLPCRQRQCRAVPSVSFDQTETITVPIGGTIFNQTLAQTNVRLTMSS